MLTVDARCHCDKCEARTKDIYRMVGHCTNCGQKDILILIRAGDEAPRVYKAKCPTCGVGGYGAGVQPDRLATGDGFPDA